MNNTKIQDIKRLSHWRKSSASHLFETDSQLQWFIRSHRDQLVNSGAYIPGMGRRPSFVDSPIMDAEVVAIMKETNGDAA